MKTRAIAVLIVAIFAVTVGVGVAGVAGGGGCGGCGGCPGPKAVKPTASPAPRGHGAHHAHAGRLVAGLKQIDAAIEAVKDGRTQDALAALAKARAAVAEAHKTLVAAVKPRVVNAKCPIMGSKINPSKVPAKLLRTFNGRTVGFCCAGCPAAWDKLTVAQKQAKLQAVLPKTPG